MSNGGRKIKFFNKILISWLSKKQPTIETSVFGAEFVAMKAGVEETIAKYDGEWALEKAQKDPLNGDLGLVMKSKAKHAAISAPLGKNFKFDDKPLES